jgi:hypothetical protein
MPPEIRQLGGPKSASTSVLGPESEIAAMLAVLRRDEKGMAADTQYSLVLKKALRPLQQVGGHSFRSQAGRKQLE